MTYTANPNQSSFRFLLLGGWTAIKSATIGSMFIVLLNVVLANIYVIWQDGIQAFRTSVSEPQDLLSAIALLLLLAILISTVPAFIGGMFLAWLLKRMDSNGSRVLGGKFRLGALIGAAAGVILTLVVLVPIDAIARLAHGGFGYNPISAAPWYLFYAIEFILIAIAAGAWTDKQLRKQLSNRENNKTS